MKINRRDLLAVSAAGLAGAAGLGFGGSRPAFAQEPSYTPEAGASLRLLRGATPQQAMGIAERQEEARRLLRYFGLRQGVEDGFWKELDTVYFLRHDAEEIAWHTRALYHRPAPEQPVVKARLPHIGEEGLQVMVYVPDQPHLVAARGAAQKQTGA